MQVLRHPKGLELILFQPEVVFLKQALEQIIFNYRTAPEDLPDSIRQKWFPGQEQLDDDDLEILHEDGGLFRGENATLAQKILSQLNDPLSWPLILLLDWDEADRFLTVINDQRLYLAAVFGVNEVDMTSDLEEVKASEKKSALIQIHFLAWMVELMVMRMSGRY